MKKIIQYLFRWRDCRVSDCAYVSFHDGQDDFRPRVLFLFGILGYFTFLVLMQPKWLFSGEMYNEMATNYYHFSLAPSLFGKLFSLDAGYIPLPQRILALFGWFLKIPVNSISYFYTWSALFFTAALTLSFCAKRFRAVIVDDGLRLVLALSVLIVVDFETRTFINFSYFSVFFVSVIAILAITDTSRDVPAWAWIIPVLMLSKPAVLSVVPFMLFAAILSGSGRRFRYISALTLLVSLVQIVQLTTSAKSGVMGYAENSGFSNNLDRVLIAIKTFFSFLGAYVIGPDQFSGVDTSFYAGVFLLAVLGVVVKTFRQPSVFMCVCGVFLLFSSIVLNVFALPRYFDSQVSLLASGVPLYRHTIVAFWGVLFIVAGLCVYIKSGVRCFIKSSITKPLSSILFVSWFVLSGWLNYGVTISREWWAPFINNSQWQSLSASIQAEITPLCVPVDPFYFIYGDNCRLLSPTVIDFDFDKKNLERVGSDYSVDIFSPQSVVESNLVAVAVLVYPVSNVSSRVEGRLSIELADGKVENLHAEKNLDYTGGMVYFSAPPKMAYKGVKRISLIFDQPIKVAYSKISKEPVVMWMGTDFLPDDFEKILNRAVAGDATAQVDLAKYYELGRGIPLNLGEAFNWYMKSALQGNAEAQLNIGLAYRYGKGVPKSDLEALKWFELAAEQGWDNAQSEIKKIKK